MIDFTYSLGKYGKGLIFFGLSYYDRINNKDISDLFMSASRLYLNVSYKIFDHFAISFYPSGSYDYLD